MSERRLAKDFGEGCKECLGEAGEQQIYQEGRAPRLIMNGAFATEHVDSESTIKRDGG